MKFHIDNDVLTVTLKGGEQFWAIKRKLEVARVQIIGLQWHDTLVIPRRELGWRFGTLFPGVLFAGTFLGSYGRNFLYVQHASGLFGNITMPHVLIFELADHAYKRIILTVDDPDMATQLIAWWRGQD